MRTTDIIDSISYYNNIIFGDVFNSIFFICIKSAVTMRVHVGFDLHAIYIPLHPIIVPYT